MIPARVSAINQGLYRTFLSPVVQQLANDYSAAWLRRLHPHRSSPGGLRSPLGQEPLHWRAVAADNPFLALQDAMSRQIVEALNRYRDVRDQFCEALFLWLYGTPLVQAAVGLRADDATARARVGRDLYREAASAKAVAELEARLRHGGLREAVMRALLYIGMGDPQRSANERGFAVLRQARAELAESQRLTLAEFKDMVRAQYLLLRRDEERALEAILRMLPADASERLAALEIIRRIVAVSGSASGEVKRRLAHIEEMFERRELPASEARHERWTVASVPDGPTSRRRKAITSTRSSREALKSQRF